MEWIPIISTIFPILASNWSIWSCDQSIGHQQTKLVSQLTNSHDSQQLKYFIFLWCLLNKGPHCPQPARTQTTSLLGFLAKNKRNRQINQKPCQALRLNHCERLQWLDPTHQTGPCVLILAEVGKTPHRRLMWNRSGGLLTPLAVRDLSIWKNHLNKLSNSFKHWITCFLLLLLKIKVVLFSFHIVCCLKTRKQVKSERCDDFLSSIPDIMLDGKKLWFHDFYFIKKLV